MADEESETSDESLDAGSEKFDPLKALYSPKVRLASSAPIYDNVSKFESVLKNVNAPTKQEIAEYFLGNVKADFFRLVINS
ncbi:U7 snRNA-associated Sm-like protein LSm11 [Temnothorax longispinosus]|uniref:U7 snRNA-associated Sm-like protein LSm11 n=1 Tax=Temnothorax longispinosus TaxID=300112 RepID=A0A4V3SA23_9HYME|nr:U7 snRNA-associated Sm-like protein LSm11 [Temnothorax longispinosus]